jgi:hypothetical protein
VIPPLRFPCLCQVPTLKFPRSVAHRFPAPRASSGGTDQPLSTASPRSQVIIKLCQCLSFSYLSVTITSGVSEMDMRGRWRVYVSAGCAEQGGWCGCVGAWGRTTTWEGALRCCATTLVTPPPEPNMQEEDKQKRHCGRG